MSFGKQQDVLVIFARYNSQTSRCHTTQFSFHVEHDRQNSTQRPRDIRASK